MKKQLLMLLTFWSIMISCKKAEHALVNEKQEQYFVNAKKTGLRPSGNDKARVLNASLEEKIKYKKLYLREAVILLRDLNVSVSELFWSRGH